MATRYSGNATIRCTYRDQGDYKCSVSSSRGRWTDYVRPAPIGFGAGVGYDSPRAYDSIAESALVFADHDKPGIADEAEYSDQGYKIRRVKGWWEKNPGGTSRMIRRSATRTRRRRRITVRRRGR